MLGLRRNPKPEKGHDYREIYVVESVKENALFWRMETGDHKGIRLTLPRIYFHPGDDDFELRIFDPHDFQLKCGLS